VRLAAASLTLEGIALRWVPDSGRTYYFSSAGPTRARDSLHGGGLITGDTPGVCTRISAKAAIATPHYLKRKTVFASALSASSAAVTEACPIGHGPIKSGRYLSSQTSPAGPSSGCPDQNGDPLSSRTLLTVLMVFAGLVCILNDPYFRRGLHNRRRPRHPKPRRKVCARRRQPASARAFLGLTALGTLQHGRSRRLRSRPSACDASAYSILSLPTMRGHRPPWGISARPATSGVDHWAQCAD
jgi:hypothetical protein